MTLSGLYPIVDLGVLRARGIDPVAFAEEVLAARPPFLQLRAKGLAPSTWSTLASELDAMCIKMEARFVVNDHPDVAYASAGRWVHVGQGDTSASELRRLYPGLSFGVSTHSIAELERALVARPGYVAFGPIFGTTSKVDAEPTLGIGELAQAHLRAKAAKIPLVAIGGLSGERVGQAAKHADLVAMISGLLPDASEALESTAMRAAIRERALDARQQVQDARRMVAPS